MGRGLYQVAQTLTHEDAQPRLLARSGRRGDVVHRRKAATKSSERGLGTLRALFWRPSDGVAPSG